MLKRNVGKAERAVRVVMGLALLVGFFLNADAGYRWLYLIGLVPLITGAMGTCPAYSIFGISTCKTGK